MSEPGVEEFRQVQKGVWGAGAFDEVAKRYSWAEGPVAVEAAAIQPGDRVLDVACGTGNVAIRAAQAGGQVTGIDIAPDLLGQARENAAEAGVELELVEGDAAELPFEAESFDAVTSVFGIQFAPRQADCAAGVGRVLKPGGRMALANWTPPGFVGQTLATMSKHTPQPPEFVQPPPMWGVPEHVAELFAGTGVEIATQTRNAHFTYASAEGFVDFMAEHYGPSVVARAALSEQGRWEEVRAELIAMTEGFNRSDSGFEVEAEYLLTTGTKTE